MLLGFALVLTLLQVGVSFQFAAVPFSQYQADLMNDLEQISMDKLQKYLHEAAHINQHEIAPQQYQPRPRHPAYRGTPADLQAIQTMFIRNRNSGLVLQYMPYNEYQMVTEHYNSSNTYQQ